MDAEVIKKGTGGRRLVHESKKEGWQVENTIA